MTDAVSTAMITTAGMVLAAVATYTIPKIIEAFSAAMEKRSQAQEKALLATKEISIAEIQGSEELQRIIGTQLVKQLDALQARVATLESRVDAATKEAAAAVHDANNWKYAAKLERAAGERAEEQVQALRNQVTELERNVKILSRSNDDLMKEVASLRKQLHEAGIDPQPVIAVTPAGQVVPPVKTSGLRPKPATPPTK